MQLIDDNSLSTHWVPSNPSVDTVWTNIDFDALAHGFSIGPAALGAENPPQDRVNFARQFLNALPDKSHAVYARVEFHLEDASAVETLTLGMKFDNGYVAYLNGKRVADANAPPELDWLASAGGERGNDDLSWEFVEFDLHDSIEQLVDGKNVLALHGLNDLQDLEDLLLVPNLRAAVSNMLAVTGSEAKFGHMPTPTPGEANVSNDDVFSGVVAEPQIRLQGGFFNTAQVVEIATRTPGAEIYFTTDGSQPSLANPAASRYSEPLTVTSTTVLRARALKADFFFLM